MKVAVVVTLLSIIFLAQAADYIAFGEQAVNAIFKEQKTAVILFTENGQGVEVIKGQASGDQTDLVYTSVDKQQNSDHFTRFAEYLGVQVDEPKLIVLKESKKKYVTSAVDLTSEAVSNFVSRVEAGEVKRFLKSAPAVENDVAPVKTLVGSNYQDLVKGDDKEYLVKVYAPWCGHCKKIAPEFVAAAEAIKTNPNIVLAEFDDSLDYSGFPTLFWYGKDKTAAPLTYNGGRDKAGIIDWLKDHTQHEWVDPSEATDEEL